MNLHLTALSVGWREEANVTTGIGIHTRRRVYFESSAIAMKAIVSMGPDRISTNQTRGGIRSAQGKEQEEPCNAPPISRGGAELTDSRQRQGKWHEMGAALPMIFLAILSGEQGIRGVAAWIAEQRWRLSTAVQVEKQPRARQWNQAANLMIR
jgi:hypothetical protein